MDIKIRITNALTGQVELDFVATVVENADIDYMHNGYSEAYPDSHVNFFWDDNKSFICGVPYNMTQDEIAYDKGLMTWNEYCNKWYKGALCGCNEDETEDFDFTFETEADQFAAERTGYIEEYNCVRVEVRHPNGGSIDFPIKNRESFNKFIDNPWYEGDIVNIYPTVHSYDLADYL